MGIREKVAKVFPFSQNLVHSSGMNPRRFKARYFVRPTLVPSATRQAITEPLRASYGYREDLYGMELYGRQYVGRANKAVILCWWLFLCILRSNIFLYIIYIVEN